MKKNDFILDRATFSQLTLDVKTALSHQYLFDAISILLNLLEMLGRLSCQSTMIEQLITIKSNYDKLLHYMKEGTEDPLRTVLHRQLIEQTFTILQDLIREYDLYTQDNIYTAVAHEFWKERSRNDFLAMLQCDFSNDFEAQDNLFNFIWTAPQLTHQEEHLLKHLLLNQDTPVRQYVLNALSLANVHYFDPAKLRLLCDKSYITSRAEQAAYIIGIFLTTSLHHSIIQIFPDLSDELRHIDLYSSNMLTTLQHFVCLYLETERVHERMEKQIVPTLIKVSQERQKNGLNASEINLTESTSSLYINQKAKAQLSEGIREMVRLSKEGMDTHFYTFIALKKFPFFQSVNHWLAPFTENRFGTSVGCFSAFPLCDSDKYSMFMFFHYLKNDERIAEIQKLMDNIQDKVAKKQSNRQHIQNTIQCFYRLFKCSPWISMWPNIFTIEQLLIHNPILGPILKTNNRFLIKTGQLLFHNKHYKEAELHLKYYAEKNGGDFKLLMQLGICAQEQGHLRKAISYYQQAEALNPKEFSIRFRIQHCLSLLGKHEERLKYLLEMEKMEPDDTGITMNVGLCLIQLQKWEEALKRFYKLEFKEQKVATSLRAIAWCLLRSKRFEEAEKYYKRLVDYFPADIQWKDRLNAGHVAWAMGNTKQALELYIDYTRRYAASQPEKSDLLLPFTKDREILHDLGFDDKNISLMHDMIYQNL